MDDVKKKTQFNMKIVTKRPKIESSLSFKGYEETFGSEDATMNNNNNNDPLW